MQQQLAVLLWSLTALLSRTCLGFLSSGWLLVGLLKQQQLAQAGSARLLLHKSSSWCLLKQGWCSRGSWAQQRVSAADQACSRLMQALQQQVVMCL
jgi:hypothetical protein